VSGGGGAVVEHPQQRRDGAAVGGAQPAHISLVIAVKLGPHRVSVGEELLHGVRALPLRVRVEERGDGGGAVHEAAVGLVAQQRRREAAQLGRLHHRAGDRVVVAVRGLGDGDGLVAGLCEAAGGEVGLTEEAE
jgi:hypothetical protein